MEASRINEPEINKSKEALGLAGARLADVFSNIRSAYKIHLSGNNPNIGVEIQGLVFELESIVQSVFIVAKPYVLVQDQKDFLYWEDRLKKLNENYSLEELKALVDFTELMLKNTNLTELGIKSRFKEIEEVIDVSDL